MSIASRLSQAQGILGKVTSTCDMATAEVHTGLRAECHLLFRIGHSRGWFNQLGDLEDAARRDDVLPLIRHEHKSSPERCCVRAICWGTRRETRKC